MKLKELLASLENLDPSKMRRDVSYFVDSMAQDLGVQIWGGIWDERVDEEMYRIPVQTWICTDTEVGLNAIFFRGEFAALSWQSARRNGTQLYWSSKDMAGKVRNFLVEGFPTDDGISVLPEDYDLDAFFFSKENLDEELISTGPIFMGGKFHCWEAFGHDLKYYDNGEYIEGSDHRMYGPTRLIAGLRCLVPSKLGDEVDVPEELL